MLFQTVFLMSCNNFPPAPLSRAQPAIKLKMKIQEIQEIAWNTILNLCKGLQAPRKWA